MSAVDNAAAREALLHVARVLEREPWRDPVAFLRECADELTEDEA